VSGSHNTIDAKHVDKARAAGAARHWVPASHFVLHDDDVTTSLQFSPRVECRKLDATFHVRVSVYDGSVARPALEYVQGPLGMNDDWILTSTEIAARLGHTKLFHYLEVHFWSDDAAARTSASVAESFAHYSSRSGTMEAHLPSAFIYGSGRFSRKKGPLNYQNYPGVETRDMFVTAYTINPFARRANYRVILVDAGGRRVESAPVQMPGKAVSRWTSDAGLTSGLVSPAGVIIASDLKLTSFVGQLSARSGRMIGLDHTHPFISV